MARSLVDLLDCKMTFAESLAHRGAFRLSVGHSRTQRRVVRVVLRAPRIELSEDLVHNSGRQKNLTVRNRQRSALNDRSVEGLDQDFHARLHVEVPCQKLR